MSLVKELDGIWPATLTFLTVLLLGTWPDLKWLQKSGLAKKTEKDVF